MPFGTQYADWAQYFYQQRIVAWTLLQTSAPGRVLAVHPIGFPGRPLNVRTSVTIIDDAWCSVGTAVPRQRGLSFDGTIDLALSPPQTPVPRRQAESSACHRPETERPSFFIARQDGFKDKTKTLALRGSPPSLFEVRSERKAEIQGKWRRNAKKQFGIRIADYINEAKMKYIVAWVLGVPGVLIVGWFLLNHH